MAFYEAINLFWKCFTQKVNNGENIFLVTSDHTAPLVDEFREKYPDNYISVGIAEQNLLGVAAGIALAGEKAVTYSYSPFLSFRGFDHIRNCIGYMELPIMLVSENTGLSYNGMTHMALEDLNILRGCHSLEIINVSDKSLTKFIAGKIGKLTHPVLVRFDKLIDRDYGFDEADYATGFRVLSRSDGERKNLLLTTGTMVADCLDLLRDLPEVSANTTLADVFKFPFDEAALLKLVSEYRRVVTVEEMLLQGGLGSAVLEAMSDAGVSRPVRRLGVDVRHGFPERYGSREYHLAHTGLSREEIAAALTAT